MITISKDGIVSFNNKPIAVFTNKDSYSISKQLVLAANAVRIVEKRRTR